MFDQFSYRDSAKAGALFGTYMGVLAATVTVTAAVFGRVFR